MVSKYKNKTIGSEVEVIDIAHEYVTFYVNNILMGVDIQSVQEINRFMQFTDVPRSSDFVKGVINLRGQVITVLDIKVILGLEQGVQDDNSRNLILNTNSETIGLLIDNVSDVVSAKKSEIDNTPANVGSGNERFFQGIYKMSDKLLVILDVNELLNCDDTITSIA